MITGLVDQFEPVVELEVFDAANQPHLLRVVVDTGYNGCLTLPKQLVNSLGLPCVGQRRALPADGAEVLLGEYAATISWDSQHRQVGVTETEGGALLGMEMIEDHRLTIDAVDGGVVRIEALTEQS
jgi:clan AA aspartic protease